MATGVAVPDGADEFPASQLAAGLGTGRHPGLSRDQPDHRLEHRHSSPVSATNQSSCHLVFNTDCIEVVSHIGLKMKLTPFLFSHKS